jgi:hypothetical protein
VNEVTLRSSALTVSLANNPAPTSHQARTVLFAARGLTPGTNRLEAYVDDRRVAAFAGATIDAWSNAPGSKKDFALIEALYECAVECGRDRDETLADALASAVRLVLNVDGEALGRSPSEKGRQRFAKRLGFAAQFASRERATSVPTLARPVARLRAARDAARAATADANSARRFSLALEPLQAWANTRTLDWYGAEGLDIGDA